jgi:hypothetical protein
LNKEYNNIPKNIGLFFPGNNTNVELDASNSIKDYNLKDNSEITIYLSS